ncbi:hypothetical protein GUV62_07890 [Stenotrophomonas maltophilia]|uniref:hypothetical protein n=1 Tax=Stenotrophomonas maltophilia TaxID=40324 RepID=UPI001F32037E|nr:hypothetical protein [Stenotrophomonas maltophilia]MCF3492626.1 hypothetical protein [Stenotrophomonas maltophilia]MCF3512461.1 hypothetical protein [Stenotrophomonas maltophilia]
MADKSEQGEAPKRKDRARPSENAKEQVGGDSSRRKVKDQLFSEMAIAAQEAVTDPATSPPISSAVSPQAKEEVYDDEFRLNQRANREMRRLAFNVVGGVSALYVIVLLCVLWRFFDGRLLASILGAPGANLDWHMLVLIGVALVIFAAIPLSLAMALVKMISESSTKADSFDLKMPNTELGKVLLELFKSMLAASKSA